ncbi:hypothetical protein [Planomonospora sp. ID82291]|uniref:hypothetical protein n=1 Tax=Planomonospora sp. ID82291 TaxID=2738136 RepID=UPI0018C3C3D2|nr:hypothetical protein [Planomonospora sp. ID82291]MBG0818289.1 hypothetical protein [Planomonospora sp. ID82291]
MNIPGVSRHLDRLGIPRSLHFAVLTSRSAGAPRPTAPDTAPAQPAPDDDANAPGGAEAAFMPPPGGCRWCGIDKERHFTQLTTGRGFHQWEPRSIEQIRAWAKARQAERRARDAT